MNEQRDIDEFVQATRVLRMSSPVGEDILLPERVTLDEGVNALFEVNVSVRSKQDIKPSDLIGKLVDLEVEVSGNDGVYRPINGLVTDIQVGPKASRGLRSYALTLRPQFWLLSQRTDHRIWLDQTATEVLEKLLNEHGLPGPDLSGVVGSLPKLHYSVQHGESDLSYVVRRMEEVGLFWWFAHEKGQHKLHVANHASGWLEPSASAGGESRVRLALGSTDRNHINSWQQHFTYVPGARAGADWNFETPRTDVRAATPSLVSLTDNARREIFEYPSRTATVEEAELAGKLRMQASEADHETIQAASNIRFLEAGRRFQPYDVVNPDASYEEHVITRIRHQIVDTTYETADGMLEYQNAFEAVPSRVPLTPHRNARRPKVEGNQIAIVAGPPGEEIHTDKYGRIKLAFPWDRRAKKDGSDTCWVRVSQVWGGGTWGAQVIPRIGMEVLVSYIDGDPDRPLVVGVVPNPDNMPAYDLPANKTRMVLRSNTHKGQGFNEITFEDEAGKENQFFHAQKDRTERVLNDRTKRIDRHEVASVGGNRTVEVSGNQKHEIGGSVNTVIGGTGPMATLAMAGVQALSGQTAGLFSQAAQIAGGSGPGVAAFATTLASSALGFLGAGGLSAREGVVSGPNPRADAGTSLAGSGTGVGEAASSLFPLSGIENTIISLFKSTSIGVGRAEQIGVSKVTNVGSAYMVRVGQEMRTDVGKKIDVEVGELYNLVTHDKFHGEAKTWEVFVDDTIRLSAPGGYIEINKKGIKLYALKIDIEGNRINFKKGGAGKGTSCLKKMSQSQTPFVRL